MRDSNVFHALSTYRFFAVDAGAVVLWDRCVECLDDDDALATAATLSKVGETVEIWDVGRFVGAHIPEASVN